MHKLPQEDKVGLIVTVIAHLAVIIVFLVIQIGREWSKESSFVLDFTKQELLEKQQQEASLKEEVSRKLDELLGQPSYKASDVRNVAVDRSALKDDRHTDAEELYKDAERLARELKSGNALEEDAREEAVDLSNRKEEVGSQKQYKGPSVVSYNLDGRKASSLRIPAYRCMGAGDVTVIITVNPSGTVVGAKVLESASSSDKCLRDFAIRAARTSRFSATTATTANQIGDITYRFIAQ